MHNAIGATMVVSILQGGVLPQQIQHLLYTLKADYILPSTSGLLPRQWPNPLPEHNTAASYGQ